MLPVYRAISFNRIIDKGGRTKPWSILVDTGEGIKPYVVKMFSTKLINERNSVCNEVLGNVLAKQFDLPVPSAALIEMDENFRMTIFDPEVQEVFENADERLKFGSELLEGTYLFNPAFTKRQASKMIEIDSLFAFDNLIRNRDRNNLKPNLLVRSNSAFLIDHELGFEMDDNTLSDFRNGAWDDRLFQFHIFYNYLKKSIKTTKTAYFEEFRENLIRLNIKELDSYFQQLHQARYNISLQPIINAYLLEMKNNSTNFVNLLKRII